MRAVPTSAAPASASFPRRARRRSDRRRTRSPPTCRRSRAATPPRAACRPAAVRAARGRMRRAAASIAVAASRRAERRRPATRLTDASRVARGRSRSRSRRRRARGRSVRHAAPPDRCARCTRPSRIRRIDRRSAARRVFPTADTLSAVVICAVSCIPVPDGPLPISTMTSPGLDRARAVSPFTARIASRSSANTRAGPRCRYT